MINIPKKIAYDMQQELNKIDGINFDVNYMSARVDTLTTIMTKFDSSRKQLEKVKEDYVGAMIVNPNLSNIYSKPTTRTYDGNFNIVFAIDHKKMNEVFDAINEFAFNINGLYLVDKKDNKYADGSLQSQKGLRRKYKASIGIEGLADNGAETIYQTYTLTIGCHVSNQIMGDDYKFTLINKADQSETPIDELVRTDLGGDDTETNTEESNNFFSTLITGSKEQYTFTKFIDPTDPFVIELLNMKLPLGKFARNKYALKREIFDVNDNDEYVASRTDLYEGIITNPTQEFDKGREAIISFYYEAANIYNPPQEEGEE